VDILYVLGVWSGIAAAIWRSGIALVGSGSSDDIVFNVYRKVKHMNQAIGKRFPDIELPDQDGQLIRLSQWVGKFPFILSFYRGYW
jgi:hypothetical protein